MMHRSTLALAGAALFTLTACGGEGDDKLGEQAQEQMENRADQFEAAADNASGTSEDMLDAQADAARESGAAKEEAIDDADVDADSMSNEQKNAVINGM